MIRENFFWPAPLRGLCILLITLFLSPLMCYAEIWITEIHYNPEGADSGYEWIEIWNNSSEEQDIADYKFRENDVNHGLKAFQGDMILSSMEYAVIADNPDKFRSVHPEYAGTLIDSAFSLSNSGELLQLVDPGGSNVFEVTYTNTYGDGNGHSVGLVDATWTEVESSPGMSNQKVMFTTIDSVENVGPVQESDVPVGDSVNQPEVVLPATYIEIRNPGYSEKLIKVDALGDRTVMAGVQYWFEGKVYGLSGGLIEEPSVRWNWGDGSHDFGIPAAHTYRYPGVYTLVMSGRVSSYTARDRVQITVIEPSLAFAIQTDEENYVLSIVNNSDYSLEISGYEIRHDEYVFTFPQDSFINASQTLVLNPELLGFSLNDQVVFMQDGNGNTISSINVASHRMELEVEKIMEQQTLEEVESEDVSSSLDIQQFASDQITHSIVYRGNQLGKDVTGSTSQLEREYRETPPAQITSFDQLQQAQLPSLQDNGQQNSILYSVLLGIALITSGGLYVYARIQERNRLSESLSGVNIID